MHRFRPTSALTPAFFWSLAAGAYSALAVSQDNRVIPSLGDLPGGLEATVTLAISLMLAFRANRAFERWWEGRILWGTLVNACRNLAVKANQLVLDPGESLEQFRHLIVCFPKVLRDELRDRRPSESLKTLTRSPEKVVHAPSFVVNRMYHILEQWKRQELIRYNDFRVLDREARVLLQVCGGCERIKNTPIAVSFRVFLTHATVVFLLTLPWGVADQFGWWTVPITFFAAYFTIAAEEIADHIEQPFRADGDGLNLDGICDTIELSVNGIFADPGVPLDGPASG